jgi:tRNA(fMet)-specific endonuclease VapC
MSSIPISCLSNSVDLRIAAIILDHGAKLVTRNLRDFQRVPGLVAVDWTR